jgi:glucokinase
LAGTDPVAEEALSLFVTCLGRTAGDLALVFMSRGGVFLTGGIAQKIVPALKAGNFRAAFEDKAPHSALLAAMPVYVITHPLAALSGLAAYARTPGRFGVATEGRRWRSE